MPNQGCRSCFVPLNIRNKQHKCPEPQKLSKIGRVFFFEGSARVTWFVWDPCRTLHKTCGNPSNKEEAVKAKTTHSLSSWTFNFLERPFLVVNDKLRLFLANLGNETSEQPNNRAIDQDLTRSNKQTASWQSAKFKPFALLRGAEK